MTAEYREKLRHWLTSMLVMTLLIVIFAGSTWIVDIAPSAPRDSDYPWSLLSLVSLASEAFVLLFIALALWHFSDFGQGAADVPRSMRKLLSYGYLIGALIASGAAALFAISPVLNDLGCPEVVLGADEFRFDGCGSWTPDWKIWIAAVATSGLYLLAIGKFILLLWCHARRWLNSDRRTA